MLPYWKLALIWVITWILAGLRIWGVTHSAYQAAAHLFVGYCFAKWVDTKEMDWLRPFVLLCVIETIFGVVPLLHRVVSAIF